MMRNTLFFLTFLLLIACQKGQQISTIDSALQIEIDSILENKLSKLNALSGQAIIMEVQTGQIKALVGLERKDSANYQSADNFCIARPTGLFRTMSLLAILESGKVHLSDGVNTGNGTLILGYDTIHDHNWYKNGYGEITVLQGFAYSSNIMTALCLQKAFPNDTEYYEQLYKMSVNKPDSIKGLHYEDDIYVDCNYINAAIGYHKSSPIQTLTFYNAIANNGKMVQPQLNNDSTIVINPQIASKANIDSLKYTLKYVVTDGLGKIAHSEKVQVAGMSGIIQFADESYMIEFCGYFPTDNPKYSVIITINKTELPASGGLMAGDVFRQIVDIMNER